MATYRCIVPIAGFTLNKTYTGQATMHRHKKRLQADNGAFLSFFYEEFGKYFEKVDDKPTGANNGGKNNFYSIPDWVTDCDLLAEYLELDPYESNILKTLWLNKGLRHDGTNVERELNKRKHYAQMCVDKHKRNKG